MIIWISFSVIYILLAFLSIRVKGDKLKYLFRFLLIISTVYFTGFRDGIGQDYNNYVTGMKYISALSLKEPFRMIISIFVNKTIFSYVLFFLVNALITHLFFIKSIYRFDLAFTILLLYLFNPSLFGQSFNLVRQMFSASLFFFALKYIESNNFRKYSLVILIAIGMHMSSIILFPIFYYARAKVARLFFIIGVIFSYCFIFFSEYISMLFFFLPQKYKSLLLNPNLTETNFSILIMVYNILWIFCLIKKDEIYKLKYGKEVFNLGFLALFFYNISSVNVIFQRVSIFFLIFLVIQFGFLAKVYKIKRDERGLIVNSLLILLFASIFIYNLYRTPVESLPLKLLPLSAIID